MKEILITDEVLSPTLLLEPIPAHEDCGARLVFSGVVRNENKGKKVAGIDYECYERMAKKEMTAIAEEAGRRWKIHGIKIAHAKGFVKAGETSLLVAVCSAHRQEAFAAAQFVIDTIKEKVPIWKKEHYENGEANRPDFGRGEEPAVWKR